MTIPRVGCGICGQVGGSHSSFCPRWEAEPAFILWDRVGGRRVRDIEDFYVAVSPEGRPIIYASIVVYGLTGDVLRANVPVETLRVEPLRTFSK